MALTKRESVHHFVFYVVMLTIGTGMFFGFLWSGFFDSKTLFFSMLQSLCLSSALIAVLMMIFINRYRWCSPLGFKDIAIISLIFFFGHYSFYGLFPFNASRSVSMMLMGYFVNNPDRSISQAEVADYINQEYFVTSDAVLKRLREQRALGYLDYKNDEYQITKEGMTAIRLIGRIAAAYKIEKNYAIIKQR